MSRCQCLVKPACLKKIKLMKMTIFSGKEQEETITYKRSKHKAKREAFLSAFPCKKTLSESEQICSDCHHTLKEIGSWTTRKELIFIPSQIKRIDHIQHAYKCDHCSLNNETD